MKKGKGKRISMGKAGLSKSLQKNASDHADVNVKQNAPPRGKGHGKVGIGSPKSTKWGGIKKGY